MAASVNARPHRRVLVVPLIRLTSALELLTYQVPANLEVSIGTCVRIPFRTKVIEGIIWAEDVTAERKGIKAIGSIVGSFHLTPEQISIATWLHENTLTPLPTILRSMVLAEGEDVHGQPVSKTESSTIVCPTGTARDKVLSEWAKKISAKTSCTLIVVPNQGAALQWADALKDLQPLYIIPPRSKKAQQDFRAALRRTKTYVTTHIGLLYPLPHVDRVIVDLADDEAYFAFEQAPRLDVRNLAVAFAKAHAAALRILTRWVSPTVVGIFTQSKRTIIGTEPGVTLVDRQNEPARERGHTPPTYLIEKLQTTRTLWLHSRTNEAGRYVCNDCGTQVLCPTCAKPLRVRTRSPLILECLQDRLQTAAPSTCSTCKGSRLSTRSPGIQQVARAIADTASGQSVATLERGAVQGNLQTATHVVATTAIGSYPSLRFEAAAFLQPDRYFSQPGYRSAEQGFSALALARAAVLPSGSVYVVTYNADNAAYQAIPKLEQWTLRTLQEREALLYPPAGTLVVLQPRNRSTSPAQQPFREPISLAGVKAAQLGEVLILRTKKSNQQHLLQWVSQKIDPTWEAIVNPPTLPQD